MKRETRRQRYRLGDPGPDLRRRPALVAANERQMLVITAPRHRRSERRALFILSMHVHEPRAKGRR
jgi:hypothetical protein